MKFTQTWQARLLDSNLNGKSDFFPAEVPGNVQHDYAQYAGWEDFQYGCNVKQYEALEDDYWEYRCKPHLLPNRRILCGLLPKALTISLIFIWMVKSFSHRKACIRLWKSNLLLF